MQKWREKTWGILLCDSQHSRHMSPLSSQRPLSCTRPISHSVLATKMGQAPGESFTEHIKAKAMTIIAY